MKNNFDAMINRVSTNSLKYDFTKRFGKPDGVLPLWVADMDFMTPSCVIDALIEKSRHGIFGYSESGDEYFEALRNWFLNHYAWSIQPEWLIKTPGVVFAISAAVRALTAKGDSVIIQQPVYYPFSETVLDNDRHLVVNQLVYSHGKYTMDFDDFEEKIIQNQVKLFILCSPHNPVGRVWTREELIIIGDICLKHGVTVISDEIHADIVYPGHRNLVFANVKPEFADIAITCTAPTKTFNLAGLQISNIFIANRDIRHLLKREIVNCGYSQPNIMGITACQAAYTGGNEWLTELKDYLVENLNFIRSFLEQNLPQVKVIEPEGTYLVWLDFTALGIDSKALDDLIVNHSRLWLDSGTMFGAGGEGFQRINIACPRATLEQALAQLKHAVDSQFVFTERV